MAFLNVFFKTLGFFLAISVFILIISIFLQLNNDSGDNFKFEEGLINSNNIIAVIDLNGPILNSSSNRLFSNIINFIDPNLIKKFFIELEEIKPKILVVKINSPGGTVTATSELETLITNFKKKTNTEVYFYTNEILTSGGYWIATTADKIFANYGSIIGSIGVSGPSWYYYDKPISISSGILGQSIETENGIQIFDQISGSSKDLYNPFRKPTAKELDHLKTLINEIYDDFLFKVSNSRKIELVTLKKEIGALIFTSKQAKDNYLIDDIMSFEKLKKKIIIDNNYKNYKIIHSKSPNNLLGNYLDSYFNRSHLKICNKLNSNFVSIFPIYLKNC